MLCPVSVFATYVSGGETCDTDVLNTDTGPVNLRAEFEPETINLKWYNDSNQITVPTASNSCTYDTPINLPTDPVKPGYKFKGWRVVNFYDFSTLNASIAGQSQAAKNENGVCYSSTGIIDDCGRDRYSDLNNSEWKVIYSYGTVYGESKVQNGNCYCRATGYIPSGSTTRYIPQNPTGWVFNRIDDGLCTIHCAPIGSTGWRQQLFGQFGN